MILTPCKTRNATISSKSLCATRIYPVDLGETSLYFATQDLNSKKQNLEYLVVHPVGLKQSSVHIVQRQDQGCWYYKQKLDSSQQDLRKGPLALKTPIATLLCAASSGIIQACQKRNSHPYLPKHQNQGPGYHNHQEDCYQTLCEPKIYTLGTPYSSQNHTSILINCSRLQHCVSYRQNWHLLRHNNLLRSYTPELAQNQSQSNKCYSVFC